MWVELVFTYPRHELMKLKKYRLKRSEFLLLIPLDPLRKPVFISVKFKSAERKASQI